MRSRRTGISTYANATKHAPRFLVLYGSLRERSFSRFLAHESARLLEAMGGEVRIYDAHGLPLPDDTTADHPKVQELRNLSIWSEGHVWVSPERHGNMTGVMKSQIDWLPLRVVSVNEVEIRGGVGAAIGQAA